MSEQEKFPCRTKTISGTRYLVQWFAPDGSMHASTVCDSKEDADNRAASIAAKQANYTVKITPEPWTEDICIECGKGEYW